MKSIVEAPVPFLIGIAGSISFRELPLEAVRVDLDNNKVLMPEALPKIQSTYYNNLISRLKSAINFTIKNDDQFIQNVDQAFNVVFIDPDEKQTFDYILIRDAMLEFMSKLLTGYEKLIV